MTGWLVRLLEAGIVGLMVWTCVYGYAKGKRR